MRIRWSSRGLAICAAAAVMFVTGCNGNEDKLQARVDEQAQQLIALKNANAKLETRLDEANGRFSEADEQLKLLQAKAEEEAADPYSNRTEDDLLLDKRIPADAAGLLLKLVETVHAKPKAEDKVWAQFFHDPAHMDYYIKTVLAMPNLTYAKFFYQGETTYKKPGKETTTMVVQGKLKTDDANSSGAHAFALTNVNHTGWKIYDVD
ncbi:hypothetical protein GZH47_27960 [Paenibacillus rhizovicinus]|uniref:DUF4829 domain-containing protein n=1 Tax=Paenibacillus rhizovicinus TaxID=2704463 RepID=A0A6C0P9E9_9BACL|nr:hypothetical protein [Paenibacillus rhizovicinus]QHW34253.1 hypothetical protein GZH47_27960 [Paenibacillus rhizovicinus]